MKRHDTCEITTHGGTMRSRISGVAKEQVKRRTAAETPFVIHPSFPSPNDRRAPFFFVFVFFVFFSGFPWPANCFKSSASASLIAFRFFVELGCLELPPDDEKDNEADFDSFTSAAGLVCGSLPLVPPASGSPSSERLGSEGSPLATENAMNDS